MTYCKSRRGLSTVLFTDPEQLPEDWKKLIPEGHFLFGPLLHNPDLHCFPGIRMILVLVYQHEKPVAAAYFQYYRLHQDTFDTSKLGALRQLGWSAIHRLLKPGLLVAGHLFRHDIHSFYAIPGTGDFEAYQYYKSAIDTALRKTCAGAVLVKDLPESLAVLFQNHAPQYLLLRNDISMELEIREEWSDLHDYEKALKHKYAQRFRKIRSSWRNVEVRELDATGVSEQQDLIFALYQQVSYRQPVRLGFLSKHYIPALKRLHPEQFHVWMVYENGHSVAFFSAWVKAEVFDMFYIGMDYSRNEQLQLYFNMLFFAVDQAIAAGKKRLILGRTALEAKARLGCQPRYLSSFLYIRNPVLRRIVTAVQHRLQLQEGDWAARHPFKDIR